MDSNRISRLARRLLGSDREGAFYDVRERKKYTYFNRGLALEKYVDRVDVFGSFTDLPKLGINPKTTYETPIGIYSYPIRYIVGFYNKSSAQFDVPFAGSASYIHIFTVKDMDKTLKFSPGRDKVARAIQESKDNWSVSTSQRAEIEKALKKAQLYMAEHTNKDLNRGDGGVSWKWYQNFITGLKSPDGAGIGQFHPDFQKAILAHFTFDDLIKYNTLSSPSPWEQSRMMGFSIGYAFPKILDDITMNRAVEESRFPYEDQLRNLPDIKKLSEDEYQEHKKNTFEAGQRVECDTAFVWNFLRLFANNKVKWTAMMRQMGFIGAVDYGTGTIHQNEETQAVFFDRSALEVIEVMNNGTPRQHMGYEGGNQSLLGQWAEVPERGIKGALTFLRNEIILLDQIAEFFYKREYTANRTANFRAGLKRIMSYVGWLNSHARNDHRWSPLEKSQVELGITEAMEEIMSFFNTDLYGKRLLESATVKDIKDFYERIMRSLRRR